jgi:hypothetical protein
MAERKVVLLRIRPELYEALQRWAHDEFRSVNGHLEYLLSEAVRRVGRSAGPGAPGPASGSGSASASGPAPAVPRDTEQPPDAGTPPDESRRRPGESRED